MKLGVNTKLLHDYSVTDKLTGASSIPKYQASTFDLKEGYINNTEFSYSRFSNPTVSVLEDAIKSIEKAKYGFAFSSGMSAISAAIMLARTGDHVIFPVDVYGGTCQFATEILPKYGIETTFIDYSEVENIEKSIKKNTKIIYIETPSNPLLKISDIMAITSLAKTKKIITIADNTFMTPLYQKPLDLGCDIVVESMTKFINGHSDIVGGLLATNNEIISKEVELFRKNFGSILGVEEAWLVLRGIKTLGLRMEKSTRNASKIALFLSGHPKVKKVYHPDITDSFSKKNHQRQATSGGPVLSFELVQEDMLDTFIQRVKIPIFAVSLGGVESILSHPASMSHSCLSKEERHSQGISDGLLRLSCGIEDVEDMLEDLNQALNQL